MNGLAIIQNDSSNPPHSLSEQHRPPPISLVPSLDAALGVPLTPNTPNTPTTPSSPDPKPKKSNPLVDLIDTEKLFVDQLTGIIRKVAAAWSRSNLPPPELDSMFRSIEGVYKANRGLHSKLKEIGTNPSSPKALGDLLMRWIDDLEGPYTTYCTKFCCGFDTWQPVQSNPRLSTTLSTFSAALPPPQSTSSEGSTWTLDTLFLLPKARLKYYKKLYNRLLKSTAPGRSDHRLLVGALDTLDRLLGTLDSRASVYVGQSVSSSTDRAILEPEDEIVIDMRNHQNPSPSTKTITSLHASDNVDTAPGSESSSVRGSSFSGGERLSRETVSTSISRASHSTISMPISDLEHRLSTVRTLDIFSMKPKVVKLQMTPPTLTFTREMRISIDVVIRFTPRTTGIEVVHRQGHVYLLSDLFLICEKMSLEEQNSSEGADMWLCYPPLAGKVLRVSEVTGQDTSIQVAIMRKEFLTLETDSAETCKSLLTHFRECIEFSGLLPPPTKQLPPPVPALPPMDQNTGDKNVQDVDHLGRMGSSPNANTSAPPPPAYPDDRAAEHHSRLGNPTEGPMQQAGQQAYIRTSLSANPSSTPPYFPPPNSNVVPPARGASFVPGNYGGPRPAPTNSSPHGPFQGLPPRPSMHNQPNGTPFPSIPSNNGQQALQGFPPGGLPPRPPSEPPYQRGPHHAPSIRSLGSQYSQHDPSLPPVPMFSSGYPRNNSMGNLHAPQPRPLLPSALNSRAVSLAESSFDQPSPPGSPVEELEKPSGPVTSVISAQMKCKVFLKQHHAQWKSLGSAKLKLYRQDPTNIKQLVVEADNKDHSVLISTIVLTDGVERVGKTGVAIELSDQGARTGIVYMIQLRNEKAAGGLFDSLLAGSDRSAV